MFILNNIIKCMEDSGINQKTLCEAIGISQQAFTNWKNGNNTSYKKHLPQIADILGVSVDYLLGKETATFELSEHEKELITAYRQQPEMQSAIDRILGILQKEKEQSIG